MAVITGRRRFTIEDSLLVIIFSVVGLVLSLITHWLHEQSVARFCNQSHADCVSITGYTWVGWSNWAFAASTSGICISAGVLALQVWVYAMFGDALSLRGRKVNQKWRREYLFAMKGVGTVPLSISVIYGIGWGIGSVMG